MPASLNFQELIQPVRKASIIIDEDYYIWGAGMLRTADGLCHLLYSRWPRELGHNAWLTHSEIAYAVAEHPSGPYHFKDVALPSRGEEFWDGHCTHNPTVLEHQGRYYLYYMGNRGDLQVNGDLNWTHRNNQRIGVAVADHAAGPWKRFDEPLIDVTPGGADALCTSNPSVTISPDGEVLMLYKGVGMQNPLPFGGPVLLLIATADNPSGPFRKHPEPMFLRKDVNFPAEDPFIWYHQGIYYAIFKDFKGYFTNAGQSLALWESPDGVTWVPAAHPLVSTTEIQWDNKETQKLNTLERPQIWLENGEPAMLFCAADLDDKREHSFNIPIPLKRKQ